MRVGVILKEDKKLIAFVFAHKGKRILSALFSNNLYIKTRYLLLAMYNHSLPLNGLRVLVVDSDLDSRVLLTMVFEEYGVETIAPWAGTSCHRRNIGS
jgi:hypothetical protein